MANYETRSIKEIHDDIIARYNTLRAKYGDETPLLERAAIHSLAWAFAAICATLWKLALKIYKQCFVQSCDLDSLKNWGELVDLPYSEGKKAVLQIQINNATATHISAQTVFHYLESGLTYKTLSQAVNSNNVIVASVECTTSGPIGNLETGTILTLANPLAGVPDEAQVSAILIHGSNDEETETYRKRVINKYKNKSQGGSALDYYNWAVEVPGIVDALPYVLEEGTTTIYLVGEGSGQNRSPSGSINPNPFPSWENGEFQEFSGSGHFLEVAYSIEGTEVGLHNRRPMGAHVNLLKPNYTAYSVYITNLSDVTHNEEIKATLIDILDSKRPHIKVLNYNEANAKINSISLASEIQQIIGNETFTGFELRNAAGQTIIEDVLGVGCLAYLSELNINGSKITL